MATNQTEHYALNQWALTDSVIMEEFNADNQKLDAALATLAQKIDDAVAQVKATIPRVQTGTYVGTGTCGADNPNTLTFDFTPQLLFINQYDKTGGCTRFMAVRGTSVGWLDYATGSYAQPTQIHMSWGDKSLSWYNESASTNHQGNAEGVTYHYVAVG